MMIYRDNKIDKQEAENKFLPQSIRTPPRRLAVERSENWIGSTERSVF
jgi:hypothetical protein